MDLHDLNFRLSIKTQRISYLHSIGRISNEEYEKWILSESIDFEPVVISAEEAGQKTMKFIGGQNIHFIESEESKQIRLLKRIEEILKENNRLLEEIRRK